MNPEHRLNVTFVLLVAALALVYGSVRCWRMLNG